MTVFFGTQSSVTMPAQNVLALIGGSLLLSNDSGSACVANKQGALRLNATANGLEMCDGAGTWAAFGGGASALDDLSDAATTVGDQNMFIGHEGGSYGPNDQDNPGRGSRP